MIKHHPKNRLERIRVAKAHQTIKTRDGSVKRRRAELEAEEADHAIQEIDEA